MQRIKRQLNREVMETQGDQIQRASGWIKQIQNRRDVNYRPQ